MILNKRRTEDQTTISGISNSPTMVKLYGRKYVDKDKGLLRSNRSIIERCDLLRYDKTYYVWGIQMNE